MLDRKNSVLASYSIGQFAAKDRAPYFTHDAQVALNSRVGPANFLTTYEYTDDGFTSDFLGRHRLTTEARYAEGSFGFNAFVTKSLDAERLNASVGFDYRFSQDWRMDYQYYFDQYDAESYLDHTLILAYRVGYREVGLSYSHRTKRIGLEIFGARFN
jgi:hypothetical protein